MVGKEMNGKDKLLYSHNWNIGFCAQTPEGLVGRQSLNRIQWMKHSYKDRWFADPFIYKITKDEIVVFVEECQIESPKGIICELVIDRKTKRLKRRFVLLESDTHLSYPAIIRWGDKVYVYPENGASGQLNIYEYDSASHLLVNPICILNEAVADATILKCENKYLMVATRCPKTQEEVFLYQSDSLFGPFVQIGDTPIQTSRSCSRPGGNWFCAGGQLYRPAQNCEKRYGASLSIMEVSIIADKVCESQSFTLYPESYRYNRGLHTLNFMNGICVIDGYGYLNPVAGHTFDVLKRIKHIFR